MSLGKLAVLGLALAFAAAGVGAALADWRSPDPGPAIDLVDVDARKDESADVATVEDDDGGDGDDTNGNDGTGGGDNTAPAQRAGDGDSTRGDDGTGGGDNTAPAAPRPAPADDSVSAHGGGDSVSRGGDS